MLCYVMLRYVTLRYVTLRYVTLCYVMLCYVMLRYGTLCYFKFRNVMLSNVTYLKRLPYLMDSIPLHPPPRPLYFLISLA